MALTGQLSDLSLAELIEFFCNQRKTGRLKVAYTPAPGYFYFDRGELVDAKIGALNGVDAVYYALTLKNASFKFNTAFESKRRTIHQPWAQVALEGLRRMDEGISPGEAFPDGNINAYLQDPDGLDDAGDNIRANEVKEVVEAAHKNMPARSTEAQVFAFSHAATATDSRRKAMLISGVAASVLLIIAAIGVPAGWYKSSTPATTNQPSAPTTQPVTQPTTSEASSSTTASSPQPEAAKTDDSPHPDAAASTSDAGAAARREREARDRLREEKLRAAQLAATSMQPNTAAVKPPEAAKPATKMVTVQVTYDEAGRVTQASGGDATALRIARQKRFPAGKAGSTTITIPIK